MNIVYIGSSGALSVEPLRFLLSLEHRVSAVCIDADADSTLDRFASPLIAGGNESVEMLAVINAVPVVRLFDQENDYLQQIRDFNPDLVIMSCLDKKLPDDVIATPRHGCFNLHPSLLPAFRGPVPLFWQFRNASAHFGVTLHRVTSRFDAGPIVSQRGVSMPDGVSNNEASRLLAEQAIELLKQCLDRLAKGEVITEREQNEADATTMGYPDKDDFAVDTHWSARRIFNFMRATQHRGEAYPCEVAGRKYSLLNALDFEMQTRHEAKVRIDGDTISIPCREGTLKARLGIT